MVRIPDEKNICLHCTHGEIFGPSQNKDETELRTWCICRRPNIAGGNKGHRKQCSYYEPKKEG